ncbi:DUF2786 domain-containing protein [Paractinoplanes ferrugineus]|uniref:DUF2786 domain-containing protein n=1 Tax=Paractinoplanes ferrugineus TaxID=113564 RepID=A0A919J6C3_9ACTN|nr:DUF2786 domain-containing protein [Actinoplanes ferrugineus]GIE14690.1 hypothetical protein Afe05nite_65300 [Actinoplanes ferrugineus]
MDAIQQDNAGVKASETVRAVLAGELSYEAGLDALAGTPDADAVLVAAVDAAVDRLFQGGWQPAELHRVVARRGEPGQAQIVAEAVRRHLTRFREVDPRWRAQVDDLPAAGRTGADRTRPDRIELDRIRRHDAALGLLLELRRLPRIETLVPPPGTVGTARYQGADNRILDRVRALLAKAEGTEFPAEAEAFSAKAQELIAKHSIESVLTAAPESVPLARRVGVDHPYESEKAALLDAVARANHCHTVWSPELAFSTVFGFDADIDAVELLYTSLLVQANRAMARDEPVKGKARVKAFRRSFLVAYAHRIGERLERTTRHEIERHTDLLPVLRGRDLRVREAMAQSFPRTVRARGSRVDSLEGWESGRAAADEAKLG